MSLVFMSVRSNTVIKAQLADLCSDIAINLRMMREAAVRVNGYYGPITLTLKRGELKKRLNKNAKNKKLRDKWIAVLVKKLQQRPDLEVRQVDSVLRSDVALVVVLRQAEDLSIYFTSLSRLVKVVDDNL
jgi:hypothetical protein